MGDKWTLLIVRDLAAGPRRFVELQRVLPGISTEQLRSRLNRMVADGMLSRKRYREVPPRVDYELTERARELMPVLGELARWGYGWAWSPPQHSEAVDIGAIFRLAPGLIDPSRAHGVAEFTVREDSRSTSYTVASLAGEVRIQEVAAEQPDVRVTGRTQAWINAFLPDRDRTGLEIEGDRQLAEALLEALAAGGRGRAAARADRAAA